jgi:hypothetical protein
MHVSPPLRALLRGAIDYAGLYPPAALPMSEAAARYARYRASTDRWALGRFVVAADSVGELTRARADLAGGVGEGGDWPLSVLVGGDAERDAALLARAAHAGSGVRVESIEARTPPADPARLRAAFGDVREIYCELPARADPRPALAGLHSLGLRAKLRTGGVTADAIPTSAEVARFLAACIAADVPFKATAGLHHPLRGEHPLTYEPDAPRAVMHGWLNVFLAAALLAEGADEGDALRMLEEREAAALELRAGEIVWRGRSVSAAAAERLRLRALASFGSCSFREPLDELASLLPLPSPT